MESRLCIKVLVDNSAAGRNLLGEHGLSLWIEYNGRKILFDTGQTSAVWHNARQLNISLTDTHSIVLSHGHYDHTGGLDAVLEQTGPIDVYTHPQALVLKYACDQEGFSRENGMSASLRKTVEALARISAVTGPVQITPGFWCTGPIPRKKSFEDTGGAFFKDRRCRIPDDLPDDQACFAEIDDGLVVFVGCAHAGLINTLNYVTELRPEKPIHTVIGGTHLAAANEERMSKTIAALRKFDIRNLLPMHCTGFQATARLWTEIPGRVAVAPVGTTIPYFTT